MGLPFITPVLLLKKVVETYTRREKNHANVYILLTTHKGHSGRILPLGLDGTECAQQGHLLKIVKTMIQMAKYLWYIHQEALLCLEFRLWALEI